MAIHQTALYVGIVASSFAATVGQWYGWRSAFFVFGSCGIVMAGVILGRMHDTPRPAATGSGAAAAERGPTRRGSAAVCVRQTHGAAAGRRLCGTGLRQCRLPDLDADLPARAISACSWTVASFLALFCHHAAAFVGVTAGGWLSDRFARRWRSARMQFEYLGLLLGAPFIWWMGQAGSATALLCGPGRLRAVPGGVRFEPVCRAVRCDRAPLPLVGRGRDALFCVCHGRLGVDDPGVDRPATGHGHRHQLDGRWSTWWRGCSSCWPCSRRSQRDVLRGAAERAVAWRTIGHKTRSLRSTRDDEDHRPENPHRGDSLERPAAPQHGRSSRLLPAHRPGTGDGRGPGRTGRSGRRRPARGAAEAQAADPRPGPVPPGRHQAEGAAEHLLPVQRPPVRGHRDGLPGHPGQGAAAGRCPTCWAARSATGCRSSPTCSGVTTGPAAATTSGPRTWRICACSCTRNWASTP